MEVAVSLPRRCFYSSRLQRLSEDTHFLFVQLGIYWCSLNALPRGIKAARHDYKEPDKVPHTGSVYFSFMKYFYRYSPLHNKEEKCTQGLFFTFKVWLTGNSIFFLSATAYSTYLLCKSLLLCSPLRKKKEFPQFCINLVEHHSSTCLHRRWTYSDTSNQTFAWSSNAGVLS